MYVVLSILPQWNGSSDHFYMCVLWCTELWSIYPYCLFYCFKLSFIEWLFSVKHRCHFLMLIWLFHFQTYSLVYRANLASSAIRIKEPFQKKFQCFFVHTKVLSLRTEFNSTNRCLTVCCNPFKPHWCPAGTRYCRTSKDTGLVGKHVCKCILRQVMENSHLYKLLFYSIHSKFVWLIQSNYCIWVTVCGLTACSFAVKTPRELSFLWGDKVLLIFCLVNY